MSNTDPAVVKILDSLGVLENRFEIRQAGIREDQVFTTWQLEEDKKEVRFWDEVLRRLRRDEPDLSPNEVLVIGDELVSYVLGPHFVNGLRFRLTEGFGRVTAITRPLVSPDIGHFSCGAIWRTASTREQATTMRKPAPP